MAIEIKSGRVVENVDEIASFLAEAFEKDAETRARSGSALVIDDDQGPVLMKQATVTALSAPPAIAADEVEALARAAGIQYLPDHANRVISYWASDERVDGDGDIIRQLWDFARFEKNPVLCLSHDWYGAPIGSALKWGVADRSDADYQGPALWIAGLFPTAAESERADSVFRLVKSGFLRGGSVGFRAKRLTRVEDPEERAALGLGQWGVVFEESLLIEFSPTTIGSNPGAHTSLAAAKKAGLLLADDVPVLRELYRKESVSRRRAATEWSRTDSGLVAVAKSLFPDRAFKRHGDMAAPILEEKEKRVAVRTAPSPSLEENVAALRAAADEGFPAILRRLDDISEENAELRRRLEAIEERSAVGPEKEQGAGSEDTFPTFEVSDRLRRGLDRLKAQS